jgi:DNA polymerase III delta prime subunit
MAGFEEKQIRELGFGEWLDGDARHGDGVFSLLGRNTDFERHIGFLQMALRKRRHYLLEGFPGVGKSAFVREMIGRAATRWKDSSALELRNLRFVLLPAQDFIGSADESSAKFRHLYSYLQKNPQVVPIFDGLEYLLNGALSVSEQFAQSFGGLITGGGRSVILVSRTAEAASSQMLKGIRGVSLPALSPEATRVVVQKKLKELMSQDSLKLQFKEGESQFPDLLLNVAKERYPGRFYPEVALYLCESSVSRAANRILFLKRPPLDCLTVADLWEHVAEEQSINPEVFGQEPAEFYKLLGEHLHSDVIAQDQAIDPICRMLHSQTLRPPQRAPRGRFLFVGPPGVGKTELGRSLAKRLGLGEEAFFVFNMAEYSSDAARTRFMGADPGYVGYRSTRTIYDMVRARPACVILLDEIDRSHASIHDILLSVLEGEGKDAEGNPAYFSQAIFILTTNQGQDAVCAAYYRGDQSREELGRQFTDSALRKLIIKGVLDEHELLMQKYVEAKLASVRAQFEPALEDSSGHSDLASLEMVQNYVALKELDARLKRVQSKTPLDAALLDRLDLVIPFFPIKEIDNLKRILDQKLERAGWNGCPDGIRDLILQVAVMPETSIRGIETMIKQYMSNLQVAGPS